MEPTNGLKSKIKVKIKLMKFPRYKHTLCMGIISNVINIFA